MNNITTNQYLKKLEENYTDALNIMKNKQIDYASIDDPFKNFKLAEHLNIKLEQGILIRMGDKLSRIGNLLIRNAQVKDENIEDTLKDLMNYSNILLTYIQINKKEI